jgi:hypothetical protein
MSNLLEHIIRNALFESRSPKYKLKSASIQDFNNARRVGAVMSFMIKSKNPESSRPDYYKNKTLPQFIWVQNDVVKFLQKHYNNYPSIKKYTTSDYIFLMGNIAEASKKNKILFWIVPTKTLYTNSKFRDTKEQIKFDTNPDLFLDDVLVRRNFAMLGDAPIMRWSQYTNIFIPLEKWNAINKGIESPIDRSKQDNNIIEYPYAISGNVNIYTLPDDKMVYKLTEPDENGFTFWNYMSKEIFEIDKFFEPQGFLITREPNQLQKIKALNNLSTTGQATDFN